MTKGNYEDLKELRIATSRNNIAREPVLNLQSMQKLYRLINHLRYNTTTFNI